MGVLAHHRPDRAGVAVSAAVEVEFGAMPPAGLGLVHIGTTGRKIHLASYSVGDGEGRVTLCGQGFGWPSEVQETLSGRLCPACAKVQGVTSTDDWERI
jgi:hypothetical protein